MSFGFFLSSPTIEDRVLEVVTRKGVISFNRLAEILWHQYKINYSDVKPAINRLLAKKPPQLGLEKVPRKKCSKRCFWLYYVDKNELNRKKDSFLHIQKKWMYSLARDKGDFLRDLVARATQSILKDQKRYPGWTYHGKEISNFDNVMLGRRIDVLVELPNTVLLWIECKNQMKPVTRTREITDHRKDIEYVKQKLPKRKLVSVIVCSFMTKEDQWHCWADWKIGFVILKKIYLPNNKHKKDYDEGIKEFELKSITKQIDANANPPEIKRKLKKHIFEEIRVSFKRKRKWYDIGWWDDLVW